MPHIIGLVGRRGAGKTTVANILKSQGFIEITFAEALKQVVSILFGFDYNMLLGDTPESRKLRTEIRDPIYRLTPIQCLQKVGTEIFRNHFDQNFWVNIVNRKIAENSDKDIVITDCRYENEIALIRKNGGEIWVIYNESKELIPNTGEDSHSSENSFQDCINSTDTYIHNSKEFKDLENYDWHTKLKILILDKLKLKN